MNNYTYQNLAKIKQYRMIRTTKKVLSSFAKWSIATLIISDISLSPFERGFLQANKLKHLSLDFCLSLFQKLPYSLTSEIRLSFPVPWKFSQKVFRDSSCPWSKGCCKKECLCQNKCTIYVQSFYKKKKKHGKSNPTITLTTTGFLVFVWTVLKTITLGFNVETESFPTVVFSFITNGYKWINKTDVTL